MGKKQTFEPPEKPGWQFLLHAIEFAGKNTRSADALQRLETQLSARLEEHIPEELRVPICHKLIDVAVANNLFVWKSCLIKKFLLSQLGAHALRKTLVSTPFMLTQDGFIEKRPKKRR